MYDEGIRSFFQDQTVFITGGTGFLGKVLVEKLLYSCDVKKIYILVRPKKGKTTQERSDDFFSYACFERIKEQNFDFKSKIYCIDGDCEVPNLGISPKSQEVLINETTIVIHAAANVKFDQPLRTAANINIRSTKDILAMAKSMSRLKAFIYVSTAFSNCPNREIREQFYEPPMRWKQLFDILDGIDDERLENMTPILLGKFPNTYVFTKSIAEDLIRTEGQNLPIAVIRPAIVMSSYNEPVPGWVDNFYGLVGLTVAISLGVLSSMIARASNVLWVVPCDYVVNNILAATWQVSKQKQNVPIIYNYTGSKKNRITYDNYYKLAQCLLWKYASAKSIWYPTFRYIENPFLHKIYTFFLHTVIAYIVDLVFICIGKKPIAVENYNRLDRLVGLTTYFRLHEWKFYGDNVDKLWKKMGTDEKILFKFNMDDMDWTEYMKRGVIGGRIYLIKDPLDTLPEAKNKLLVLFIIRYTLICIFWLLVFLFVKWIFLKFYK